MTTGEEFKKAEKEADKAQAFVANYAYGLVNEFDWKLDAAFMEAVRIYVKEQHGFIEPYKVSVSSYDMSYIQNGKVVAIIPGRKDLI